MSAVELLDIASYSRLWRCFWTACRIASLVAAIFAVMTGMGLVLLVIGGPEMLMNSILRGFNTDIGSPELPSGDLRILAEGAIASLRAAMSRAEFAGLATTLSALALLGIFIVNRFRLQLAVVHSLLLAITAALLLKAVLTARVNAAALKEAGAPDHWYLNGDFALILLLCLTGPLVLLLILQVVPLSTIARHRLGHEMPSTWRMTKSLGANLGFGKFTLANLSIPGAALQTGVLSLLAVIVLLYAGEALGGLLLGITSLLLFFTQVILTAIMSVVRLFRGEPVLEALQFSWWQTFVHDMQALAAITLTAAVLIALWRFGQRLNRRHRDQKILARSPAVLLLRSFVDDDARIKPSSLLWRVLLRKKRLEECVAEELTQVGPFIAIGKPGESLPPLGAERVYLSDDTWQEAAIGFILKSQRIVLIAGRTHWVQWELQKIVEQRGMGKLILILPPETSEDRVKRWTNLLQPLEGTLWVSTAAALDPRSALAVVFGRSGMTVISGNYFHEADYEAALRVATYLLSAAVPSR